MALDIDKLNIEVSASADKAEKSLDELIARLEKLKSQTVSIKGFDKITSEIDKLHAITQKLNSTADPGTKITSLVNSINKLNTISVPNLTKVRNAAKTLTEVSLLINSINVNTENAKAIADMFKPFETMGKSNLSSYLRALERLPETAKALETVDTQKFAAAMNEINTAIMPLAQNLNVVGQAFNALPNNINKVTQNVEKANTATNSFNKKGSFLKTLFSDIRVRALAAAYAIKKFGQFAFDALNESNQFVENLNLFNVAMGDSAEEAYNYAEKVKELLGIDPSEFIRNWGIFKQITTGFGVVNEKADIMSKNLTQIGYDIASFFNTDIDEAMQKVQSGISGELEPLRRLGYALDAATLQQIAYNNGITQSINTMTQAQKSQLRYIAILDQSKNVMGDMARTIITPANSMRILEQQLTQLKRALGNIISIVAVKLIPYIQVFVRLLTEAAEYLANKWGFELPKIDYSSLQNGLSTSTESVDDFAESAGEAVKQVQRLAGFDELNILQSPDTSSGVGSSQTGGGYDLGIDLPEYDFLAGLDSNTDRLYKNIKDKALDFIDKLKDIKNFLSENKELIVIIGELLASIWAVKKLSTYADGLVGLFKSFNKVSDSAKDAEKYTQKLNKIKLAAITTTFSTLVGIDFGKHLANETLTAKSAILDLTGYAGAIGVAFAATGPLGAAVTAVGGFIGMIGSLAVECKKAKEEADKAEQQYYRMAYLFDHTGVPLENAVTAFKNYTSSFDEYISHFSTLSGEIDSIQKDIDITANDIQSTFNKLKFTPEMTDQVDFTELKSKIEQLYKDTKLIIEKETQTIIDGINMSFDGLKYNVDNSALSADIYLAENEINAEIDKSYQKVNDLMKKPETLSKGSKEYNDTIKALESELTKIATVNASTVDYTYDMKWLFDDLMKSGKYDLGNEDEVDRVISELETEYNTAYEEIKGAFKTQKLSAQQLIKTADVYGIDTTPFYEYLDLLKKQEAAAFSELDRVAGGILYSISSQIGKAESAAEDEARKAAAESDRGYADLWQISRGEYKDVLGNTWQMNEIEDEEFRAKDAEVLKNVHASFNKTKNRVNNSTLPKGSASDMVYLMTGTNSFADLGLKYGLSFITGASSAFKSKSIDPTLDKAAQKRYNNYAKQQAEKYAQSTAGAYTGGLTAALGGSLSLAVMQTAASQFAIAQNSCNAAASNSGSIIGSLFKNAITSLVGRSSPEMAASISNMFTAGKDQSIFSILTAANSSGSSFVTTVKDILTKNGPVSAAAGIAAMFLSGKNQSIANINSSGASSGSSFITALKNNISGSGGIIGSAIKTLAGNLPTSTSESFKSSGSSAGTSFFNGFKDMFSKLFSTGFKLSTGVFGSGSLFINNLSSTPILNAPDTPIFKTPALPDIGTYASGGIPRNGEMFIANENGAELIGRIGSRTAVANDTQISESIRQGVRSAISETGGMVSQEDTGDIYIFLDSEQIAFTMEKRRLSNIVRSNGKGE